MRWQVGERSSCWLRVCCMKWWSRGVEEERWVCVCCGVVKHK